MIRRWTIFLAMSLAGVCTAADPVSPKTDGAVVRGLEFLAQQQKPNGSFEQGGPQVAISALSVMSFLASGHVPGDGRYGPTVRKGLDFLVNGLPPDGYVGKVDGSRMYGQGIVTLALAEAYGVEPDPARRQKMRASLLKCVEVIIAAQQIKKDENNAGGWRYEPGSGDSDLSLSGWNMLALRSCNNMGISVQKDNIDRAARYVLRCYRQNEKAFAYQPWNPPSPAMTGVGVLNLCLMDRANAPEVAAGASYLATTTLTEDTRFSYYSFYYVTHAAYQVGEPVWTRVWKMSSDQLIKQQQQDGGWPQSKSGEEPGRIYATAMAILTLSTPNGLLPVHQR